MTLIMNILLYLLGSILAFFTFYQILFVILSGIYYLVNIARSPSGNTQNIKPIRFGVIIPAHNEELLIGDLIDSIHHADYPRELYDILVISDNSTDKTADIVRSKNAKCYERHDIENRGKPYALDWLISQLNLDEYDAFVIIDADTVIHKNFLFEMSKHINSGDKAIQGYFGVMNPDETWLTRLAILPGILKFLLHYPGKELLGLSCPLAGNGMCFASEIFQKYGWKAYSIAENWEYYILLSLEDIRVASAKEAIIYSQVAKSLKTGENQRIRWLRGRLDTLSRYWAPLLKSAFLKLNFVKFDALIELVRPSHSMLLFWSILYLLLVVSAGLIADHSEGLMIFALVIILAQIIYFLLGLLIQRAPLKTWLSLIMVPPYLLWKFTVSLSGAFRFRDSKWIKTQRHKSN